MSLNIVKHRHILYIKENCKKNLCKTIFILYKGELNLILTNTKKKKENVFIIYRKY